MKINSFLLFILTLLLCFFSCVEKQNRGADVSATNNGIRKDYSTLTTVRLTVSESKRLIAKGIVANQEVRERLQNGMVIITLGTTNTYIAEELTGLQAPRGSFVTGRIFPTGKEDLPKR